MAASLLSGQVTSRTGRYKIFPVVGSMLMVVGLLVMTQIGADTPLWQTDIYMAIFGLGLGMNMQSIVLAMQNAVDPRDMGVATSAVTFFRQVGGSLGTAIFLSILFSAPAATSRPVREGQRAPRVQAAAAAHPDQLKQITSSTGLNDTSFLSGVAGRWRTRSWSGSPTRWTSSSWSVRRAGARASCCLGVDEGGAAAHRVGPAGPARRPTGRRPAARPGAAGGGDARSAVDGAAGRTRRPARGTARADARRRRPSTGRRRRARRAHAVP